MDYFSSTGIPIAKCRGFPEGRDIRRRFSDKAEADSGRGGGSGSSCNDGGRGEEEEKKRQEAMIEKENGAGGHPVLNGKVEAWWVYAKS